MTPQEALQLFKKKFNSLTVMECVDYGNYYVFVALENPSKPEFSDPYYAVDKKTKEVGYFSPADDLEAWIDACENHTIGVKQI